MQAVTKLSEGSQKVMRPKFGIIAMPRSNGAPRKMPTGLFLRSIPGVWFDCMTAR